MVKIIKFLLDIWGFTPEFVPSTLLSVSDIRGEKPLFRAIRHYQLRAFEQLVKSSSEHGVPIDNQIDAKGNTLLHAAAKKNLYTFSRQ